MKTEDEVNAALAHITEGVVGFDAEMAKRTPTVDETIILDHLPENSPHRKGALLGVQLIRLFSARASIEPIDFNKTSLCLIQIAHLNTAWVIHLTKIGGQRSMQIQYL